MSDIHGFKEEVAGQHQRYVLQHILEPSLPEVGHAETPPDDARVGPPEDEVVSQGDQANPLARVARLLNALH